MDQVVIVRYGVMGNIGPFSLKTETVRRGDRLVIRTDRGVEWGESVSSPEDIPEDATPPNFMGEILRTAKEGDYIKQQKIDEEKVPDELKYCEKMIKQHNLPMKLIAAEHLFGGNKVIFYFLADGRVDFRKLVKDLAKQYQTRIEMRQIGVRDEARLLADFEHCGCELCCRRFIKNLEPVTMKMAKNQKATLDPAKISGRCGRLMCCLRFEDKVYEELKRQLPKRGAKVNTPDGPGTVTDYDILQQFVVVDLEAGKRTKVLVKDIEVTASRQRSKKG